MKEQGPASVPRRYRHDEHTRAAAAVTVMGVVARDRCPRAAPRDAKRVFTQWVRDLSSRVPERLLGAKCATHRRLGDHPNVVLMGVGIRAFEALRA